jgi:hypothetical protein
VASIHRFSNKGRVILRIGAAFILPTVTGYSERPKPFSAKVLILCKSICSA